MPVFNRYARYYDLLYQDKDYQGEADYIYSLIDRFAPNSSSVLELGCGTGKHALLMAEKGFKVHGVDLSSEMIERARQRAAKEGCTTAIFEQGDVRNMRLAGDAQLDAVISLFHVVSYQIKNQDVMDMFNTAAEHLRPGGIFLFDCWYGPAVLSDPPVVRVKRLQDKAITVIRIAEPKMNPRDNVVDVHYTVQIVDRASQVSEEIHEVHHMRYFFEPELKLMLQNAGMQMICSMEWMSGREPGLDTWGVCFIAQKPE